MRDSILHGDCLEVLKRLPSESVHCIVTSPPYWGLRDYGAPGQLGLEPTPEEYVAALVEVFAEARRVLRGDGTLWLNLGDSYAGSWGNYAPGGIKGKQRPKSERGKRWERRAYGDTTMLPPTANVPGLKPKDLVGIPWRVAFALQADGWWLRSDIVWAKPNCMPESVRDRPTRSHEYVFLLTKSERYHYDADAIREPAAPQSLARIHQPNFAHQTGGPKDYRVTGVNPNRSMRQTLENFAKHPGRNKRSVWSVATAPYKGAHFAVMPPALVEPCVLAGCPVGGVVLDPFMGAGTVGVVARRHSRHYLGIELNPDYIALAETRIAAERQPVLWSA